MTPGGAREGGVGDLPTEELRRLAHEVSDWIADYLDGVGARPVLPEMRPGAVREPASYVGTGNR